MSQWTIMRTNWISVNSTFLLSFFSSTPSVSLFIPPFLLFFPLSPLSSLSLPSFSFFLLLQYIVELSTLSCPADGFWGLHRAVWQEHRFSDSGHSFHLWLVFESFHKNIVPGAHVFRLKVLSLDLMNHTSNRLLKHSALTMCLGFPLMYNCPLAEMALWAQSHFCVVLRTLLCWFWTFWVTVGRTEIHSSVWQVKRCFPFRNFDSLVLWNLSLMFLNVHILLLYRAQ